MVCNNEGEMMKLRTYEGEAIPTVRLNPNDLRYLATLLESYLEYLRGMLIVARKYAVQIQKLEALRLRLITVPLETKETRLLLTFDEIEILDQGLEGFMKLYQRSSQQSQESDVGLQQLREFRQELARMLTFL